jgi:hypothetical protein
MLESRGLRGRYRSERLRLKTIEEIREALLSEERRRKKFRKKRNMHFADIIGILDEMAGSLRSSIESSSCEEPDLRGRLITIENVREALLSEERRRKKR